MTTSSPFAHHRAFSREILVGRSSAVKETKRTDFTAAGRREWSVMFPRPYLLLANLAGQYHSLCYFPNRPPGVH